ncbi:MAG: MobA/MobL family protein [Rhizomicrobium sp.]
MLTLRRLDPASVTGFAATKERDWNEREDVARAVAEARKRFNGTGLPQDKAALDAAEAQRNVNIWRAAWAEQANKSLEAVGASARIDHRTLEAQGISRPPQPSLGLVRHIEKAYAYLKDRLTQWVAGQEAHADLPGGRAIPVPRSSKGRRVHPQPLRHGGGFRGRIPTINPHPGGEP